MFLSGFCKQTIAPNQYPTSQLLTFRHSCFGGAAIALGIWTYGYNIMRNLGNRLTLHSPSRGFSMELGSAVTVILATRLSMSPAAIPAEANLLTLTQSSPSPPPSASPVLPSVSVYAPVPGALSTGAWSLGFTWVGSSPSLSPVSSLVASAVSLSTLPAGVMRVKLLSRSLSTCIVTIVEGTVGPRLVTQT